MRKSIYVVIITTVFMVTSTSCKKSFLEIIPKGSLVATRYDDYNLLMNSSLFYGFNKVGIWSPAILMGDDVGAEENQYNSLAQAVGLFQWDDNIYLTDPNRPGSERPAFLAMLLQNIQTLNKIINEVEGASGGTAQSKAALRSEARVVRAFSNFQLINYFAKPYDAATAISDPGFPIITTSDVTETNFKRGTVKEMYDFIIQDLESGIENLPVQSSFRTRWSKPAAEGFLGKVYLFMGKYTEASSMFDAAFTDIAKMPSPPQLYDYNQAFAPGGAFLPIDPAYGPISPFTGIADVKESVVAINSYAGEADGNNPGIDFLTLSPKTAALFSPSDLRLKFFTANQQDLTPNPGGRLRRFTTPYSFYERIGLELSELYLLRAEARARINDLTGAKADVETLRKNRMPAGDASVPAALAFNQTSLIGFILDERIREFAALGYRWWDMRRLSVDPLFKSSPAAVHTLYLSDGNTHQFTLKPQRLTLRIPQVYLNGNPGMVDNP